jgi:hypothetical protein
MIGQHAAELTLMRSDQEQQQSVATGSAMPSDFESLFETMNQGVGFKRLSEQADSAKRNGLCFQPGLRTPGNHDHRDERALGLKLPDKIKPAHAAHMKIGDDTVTRSGTDSGDKFLS